MDRRSLLRSAAFAAVGAAAAAGLPLRAPRAQPATPPPRVAWLVAGPEGSESDRWARLVAPRLAAALQPPAETVIEDVGGADGISAANQFVGRGLPDGTVALLAPAAALLAWLCGNSRVQYDARSWIPIMAWTGPAVLYGRPAAGYGSFADLVRPRPGNEPRFGASAADGPELAALVGLHLLGAKTRTVFGIKAPGEAAQGFARGALDIGFAHGPAAMAELGEQTRQLAAVPLLVPGVLDEAGNLQRDPALPAVPHLGEAFAALHDGRAPAGPAFAAFRAALAAGLGMRLGIYLPRNTPADIVAAWRAAAARAAAAPELKEAAERAGLRPVPHEAIGAYARALTASGPDIAWLREWLAATYAYRP